MLLITPVGRYRRWNPDRSTHTVPPIHITLSLHRHPETSRTQKCPFTLIFDGRWGCKYCAYIHNIYCEYKQWSGLVKAAADAKWCDYYDILRLWKSSFWKPLPGITSNQRLCNAIVTWSVAWTGAATASWNGEITTFHSRHSKSF